MRRLGIKAEFVAGIRSFILGRPFFPFRPLRIYRRQCEAWLRRQADRRARQGGLGGAFDHINLLCFFLSFLYGPLPVLHLTYGANRYLLNFLANHLRFCQPLFYLFGLDACLMSRGGWGGEGRKGKKGKGGRRRSEIYLVYYHTNTMGDKYLSYLSTFGKTKNYQLFWRFTLARE